MAPEKGYLKTSWSMLTAEKGWYRPILVFTAVCFIPVVGSIFGSLALAGYAYEWARLTSWGVDSVPKQRNLKVGKLLSSGWRTFVVSAVWAIMGSIFIGLCQQLLNVFHLGDFGFLLNIFTILISLIAMIASLRATIYQKISAGFGFKQIFGMVKHDMDGFLRLVGISVVGGLIASLVGIIFFSFLLASQAGVFMEFMRELGGSLGSIDIVTGILDTLSKFLASLVTVMPVFILICFIVGLIITTFQLLLINSAGLWLRQFDVMNWGSESDDVPCLGKAVQ